MAACFCRGGPDCCIHRNAQADLDRKIAEAFDKARRQDTRKRCFAYCGDACTCGAKEEEDYLRAIVGGPLNGLLENLTA